MKPLFWLAGAGMVLLGAGYVLGSYFSAPATAPNSMEKADNTPKILYYRNPMGLADTSPTPKQDSMGMDYLPVYDSEDTTGDTVKVDSRKIQLLGVQTHTVSLQSVGRELRLLGTLAIDETKLADISPAFEGSITRLFVNTIGHPVVKGEVLFEVSIPYLENTEFAYKEAVRQTVTNAGATPALQRQAELQLTYAMERLVEMGVPRDERERLQRGGEPFTEIPYRSPETGVVLEKNLVQGARFTAGQRLYQIADLSSLWLIIQLPESELSHVKVGDKLKAELLTEPGIYRDSTIDFIYPTLDTSNRSASLRAIIANPHNELKPGQTAEVWLHSHTRNTLAIEPSALLDSGLQQWVLVAMGEGVYQPRIVEVGERNSHWVEIRQGLAEGEQVVSNAQFLIDSESRLQAALASFNQGDSSPAPATLSEPATDHHHHHPATSDAMPSEVMPSKAMQSKTIHSETMHSESMPSKTMPPKAMPPKAMPSDNAHHHMGH